MITRQDIDRIPQEVWVPVYLTASYCYYHMDESPLTDDAYDYLCAELSKVIGTNTHRHAKLVNPRELEVGTCMLRAGEFPTIVVSSSLSFYNRAVSGEFMNDIRRAYPDTPAAAPPPRRRTRPTTAAPPVRRTRTRAVAPVVEAITSTPQRRRRTRP